MNIKQVRSNQIPLKQNGSSPAKHAEQNTAQNSDVVDIGGKSKTPAETIKLNILHINDFHGAVEPMMDPAVSTESSVGGAANLKTLIDSEREKNPEGTLTLNAGDIAEGSMTAYISKGQVVTDFFAQLKMDATTLGNHDFAWGQDNLRTMVEGIESPVVAANVVKSDTGEVMDGIEPYIIKDLKGVKVAIIGLDTPDIKKFVEKSKLEGLDFKAGTETIKKYLPEVKEKGADLVIVLSHMGTPEDRKLAQEVPGIDIIVGGHSHNIMHEGEREGNTILLQAGSLGRFLGSFEMEIDPASKKIVQHQAKLIPVIAKDIQPDPAVEKILAPYLKAAEEYGSKDCGTALEDLTYGHREMGKLNQIHADSILEKSGAPFGICNSRTLRGHVKKGDVKLKELYSSLPFTEEGFVTLEIQGRHIKQHIEDCLADGAVELAIPMGSLKYEYDPAKPSGNRLISALIDGKEMEDDKEYFICVNETMGRQSNFAEAKNKIKAGSSQEVFFDYFKAHSPWDNSIDDRIKITSSS